MTANACKHYVVRQTHAHTRKLVPPADMETEWPELLVSLFPIQDTDGDVETSDKGL